MLFDNEESPLLRLKQEPEQQQEQKNISVKKAKQNMGKRLTRDEKMMIMIRTLKRKFIIKHKQHLMFVLKFLRQLSEQNPQLRNYKLIKLYCDAIVTRNIQKNAIFSLIIKNQNLPKQLKAASGEQENLMKCFNKWAKLVNVDPAKQEQYSEQYIQNFQYGYKKLENLQQRNILRNKNGDYYEVPRQQALGLSFMRWYNITAKCYELDTDQKPYQKIRNTMLVYKYDEAFLHNLRVTYKLNQMVQLLGFKHKFKIGSEIFRQVATHKDNKIIIKSSKIVDNIKLYSDQIYRAFIKNMHKKSGVAKSSDLSNSQKSPQQTFVCVQDNCLQMDNTLKLLKNYMKKQILNYSFNSFKRNGDLAIGSQFSRMIFNEEYNIFKIATGFRQIAQIKSFKGGVLNAPISKAFRAWQDKTFVISNLKQLVSENHSKLKINRLNLINLIFKNGKLKSIFEHWKKETIVAYEMQKAIYKNNERLNPSSQQRDKMLRFMKGLVVIQNKSGMKKFSIMAQAESRMTISKAMAIWKMNSETQGIEMDLERQYRNGIVCRLAQILERTMHKQKIVSYLALEEHSASYLKNKHINQKNIIKYYKNDQLQRKDSLNLKNLNLNIYSSKPVVIKKSSDTKFKAQVITKLLNKYLKRNNLKSLSKKFFLWKIASHYFGEQLQMTINNYSQKEKYFSLTSSIQIPAGAQQDGPYSQIQQALMNAGVTDEQAIKTTERSTTGRNNQMTSRRRWANPRQKIKYQSHCIKSGNFTIQTILKKHILKLYASEDPNFMDTFCLRNYLRHWKKHTNIEKRRVKERRHREIFTKLAQNTFILKLQYFYLWQNVSAKLSNPDSQNDSSNNQFQQIINQNIIHTQSVVNAQQRQNYEKMKVKAKKIRAKNLMIKMFQDYFQPRYANSQSKCFGRWKKKVVNQQRYELRALELTNDILMDELSQAMEVKERLGNVEEINAIKKIRCSNCIHQNLYDGMFGDDSSSEEKKKHYIVDDYKEQTDPISDPLSDSLPDKNKLSKSEKSLKMPLQMFQEEQKVRQEDGSQKNAYEDFSRTSKTQAKNEEDPSNTDGTRTQTHLTTFTGQEISKKRSQDSENVNDSGDDEENWDHSHSEIKKDSFQIHKDKMRQPKGLDISGDRSDEEHPDKTQMQNDGNFINVFEGYDSNPSTAGGHSRDHNNPDVGIQYMQFIYQENIKLQHEISDFTDQMINLNNQHLQDKNNWDVEIRDLENQIAVFNEGTGYH